MRFLPEIWLGLFVKFLLTFGEEERLLGQVLLTVETEDGPFVQPGMAVGGSREHERLIGQRQSVTLCWHQWSTAKTRGVVLSSPRA